MNTLTYALRTHDLFLDRPTLGGLFHDIEEGIDPMQIKAFVASGDGFAVLADQLDHLSQLFDKDSAEYFEMQRIVEMLLHLQDNYQITRKPE